MLFQILLVFLEVSINLNPITPQSNSTINWPTIIASIISGLASIFAIVIGGRNTRKALDTSRQNNDDNLQNNVREDRKSDIYMMLNELYGPLDLLKQKSTQLYRIFSDSRAKNYPVDNPTKFSLVIFLLLRNQYNPSEMPPEYLLSKNDSALIAQIVMIGTQSDKLLRSKAGLIDDSNLRNNLIPKLSKHYTILKLAYEGKIAGDIERFSDSMYPREMDELIREKIVQLENELKTLLAFEKINR